MVEAALDPQARSLVTPEGVDLRVRLASVGERLVALLIDFAIMLGTVIGVMILTLMAASQLHFADQSGRLAGELVAIVWLLFFFVLRNFYFTIMEGTPRAATWGKRAMGLRVAARDGGALSIDAVVARNAMREIELYLPIIVLIASAFSGGADVGGWMILCAVLWCGIFALFPLFNRDRLRAGDLIAGTWVIKTPRQKLLPDLTNEAKVDPRFAFTETQLAVYGVKELQVLESVLRIADADVMMAVADRIRAKIDWKRGLAESDLEFLSAYYAGLRRRLEQKLLLGVRKRDKFDRS
ncbi:MAG: RDD family protein [Terricaulis silvestris]